MSLIAGAMTLPAPPLARFRRVVTLRSVRLTCGLILFSYVLTHFLNHALGNVSLEAMELGLDWVAWFWGLALPGFALYTALLIHAGLGLWAIYDRPRFRWSFNETLQLLLGLTIPILLISHVTATRLAYTLFGATQGYAQVLYSIWVLNPQRGVLQGIALVIVWAHGCLGLYFWLRLKPWFPRWAPLLLSTAVLVPVLALLGYVQAGRAVLALAADPNWVIENAPIPPGQSEAVRAQADAIEMWRNVLYAVLWGAITLAIGGRVVRRMVEHRHGLIRLRYPDGRVVRVPRGTSVLEASRMAGIPHVSICGGRGRCSTCRVQLHGDLSRVPPAAPAERAVLDRAGVSTDVRLACQLRPDRDLTVAPLIPPGEGQGPKRLPVSFGEERFVVAMFVDMRGSTRLAESHLPFDAVFQINRFLETIATAVRNAGGAPNQFLGDGMLALFGLTTDPVTAARQALAATAGIGADIERLNAAISDVHEPIRFGVGVHAGTAVLGELGERRLGHSVFTAIGDVVNVAARLQSATKPLRVEALVSESVHEAAGIGHALPPQEVEIEGRDGAVRARAFPRAAEAARQSEESLAAG